MEKLDINLGQDTYSVKTSTVVKLNEHFVVHTLEGPVDLRVDIIADFANIPEKYHEVMMNVLTSKYLNKVSFGHNPFSQCKPPKKKKWYQFWLKKQFDYI